MISADLEQSLQKPLLTLLEHPIYQAVNSRSALAIFMREHVFAVWDFMSLLKRLQRDLCGITLPWRPPADASLARFINEIVLAEESDIDGAGGHVSHFELYRQAMQEVGADSQPIDRLLNQFAESRLVRWEEISCQPETREFVMANLELAERGTLVEVAAAFCYGREDIIPEMFARLLGGFEQQGSDCERFRYYLQRHVELDGDEHGPLARRLVESLCGENPENRQKAINAARRAIELRIRLWDGILRRINDSEPAAQASASH